MKTNRWLAIWFVIVIALLALAGGLVYCIDPYFHYHAPKTEDYYYTLDNERSQNDGILRNFSYDALVIGTSMTQNFRTSEVDEIFQVSSIKTPYSGGSYKEINDAVRTALENNPDLEVVIRSVDTDRILHDPDEMRADLGTHPTYLYDDNPWNDVNYLFNRDVIFERAISMLLQSKQEDFVPGITSFDLYSRWQEKESFGRNAVIPDGVKFTGVGDAVHLTEEERERVFQNITRNVTELADEYPEVTFYYFFPPYSVLLYRTMVEDGTIYRQLEAEEYAISLILEHDNIKLFSLNGREDILTDLNNYSDTAHYGEWLNRYLLCCMKQGDYLLTKENYEAYLAEEYAFFLSFDFGSLNDQEDYEVDTYAAALWNEFICGATPVDIMEEYREEFLLSETSNLADEGESIIYCEGSLNLVEDNLDAAVLSLRDGEYVGAKITLEGVGQNKYLVFEGKKVSGNGQPIVVAYDSNGNQVGVVTALSSSLDTEWHRYVLDLGEAGEDVTVILNGGGICSEIDEEEAIYLFRRIVLY